MSPETALYAEGKIEDVKNVMTSLDRVFYVMDRDHVIRACSDSLAMIINVSPELLLGSHFNVLLQYFLQRVPKPLSVALRNRQAAAFSQGEIDKLPIYRDWVVIDNLDLAGNPYQGVYVIAVLGDQIANDSDNRERLASVIEFVPHRVDRTKVIEFLIGVGENEYAGLLTAADYLTHNAIIMDKAAQLKDNSIIDNNTEELSSETIALRDIEFTTRLRAGQFPELLANPLHGFVCTDPRELDLIETSISYLSGMTSDDMRLRFGSALSQALSKDFPGERDASVLFSRWTIEQFVPLCQSLGESGNQTLQLIQEDRDVVADDIADVVTILSATTRYQKFTTDQKVAAAMIAISEIKKSLSSK